MNRRGLRSVVLAALVVASSLVAVVGPAMGQTTNTYTHTFESVDNTVVVDVGSYSGQINIRFYSPEVTQNGGSDTVWAGTLSGTQLGNGEIVLGNNGAYDNLTVTVTGPDSEPDWRTRFLLSSNWGGEYRTGVTGGDADMSCGTAEEASSAVSTTVIDCTGYPGIDSINTTNTDASQVEIDLYQDALDSNESTQNTIAVLNNYLNDTETTARLEGQNAYIRALNNGTTEAGARVAANEAIEDYYATKQRNLFAAWDTQLSSGYYFDQIETNESGVDARAASHGYPIDLNDAFYDRSDGDYTQVSDWNQTTTVTLVNGETEQVRALTMQSYDDGSTPSGETQQVGPTTGSVTLQIGDSEDFGPITGVGTPAPDSDYTNRQWIDFQQYQRINQEIIDQSESVEGDLDTIVNNTYSEYQAGDINNSDLQNPYLLAQRGPNESHEAWAAAMMTSLGVNSPENFENTGSFVVNVTGGPTYEGILFVTEETTISSGQTYNSSNLAGSEYIVTANQTHELTGTWTVSNITDTSGNTLNNTTYEDTTYQSRNVTGLIQEYENLAEERAEFEAREEAILSTSGIEGSDGEEPPIDPALAAALAAAVVVAVVVKQQTN